MTAKEFDAIVKECTDRITTMLCSTKADEYNLNKNNRFDTFYRAAEISGETPEKALFGFWLKHLVSIIDMIQSEEKFTKDRLIEKIIDSSNYGILLLGLMLDDGRAIDNLKK